MSLTEFQLIDKYFKQQLCKRDDVVVGIGDDCAILSPKPNELLAVSIDSMVAGVHFPTDTAPEQIGYKSIAVSLSDMAAMGAQPLWVTLAITLPQADENWIAAFCDGFFQLANVYNVQLVGGDITHGPLTVTTQLHGSVAKTDMLLRSTAKAGDLVFVTGKIGEAGLGLLIKQQLQTFKDIEQTQQAHYIRRLERPEPRIAIGLALRGIATAAIDVSDGLAADLKKIIQASDVGAEIYLEKLPVAIDFALIKDRINDWQQPLTAGDDYELCFTAPAEQLVAVDRIATEYQVPITQIGVITDGKSLHCFYKGDSYSLSRDGYDHFANSE